MKSNTIKSLKSLFLCLFVATVMVSCGKDDEEKECVPPALTEQIVGNWQASSPLGNISLVFTQDGELQGNLTPILLLLNISSVDELNYTVNGNNGISVTGTADGEDVGPLAFTVKERECKKITLTTQLGDIVLTQ